jgi:hypothetical protein
MSWPVTDALGRNKKGRSEERPKELFSDEDFYSEVPRLVAVSATATAAAAVSATTTGAGGAGLGFVHGQCSAVVRLTVQGCDGCFRFRIRVHLDEPEPFAPTGAPVADDLSTKDGTVGRQHRLKIRTADIVTEVSNIQFLAHHILLSMACSTRCFAFRVVVKVTVVSASKGS